MSKEERSLSFNQIKTNWTESLSEEEIENYDSFLINKYYHDVEKDAIRSLLLQEEKDLTEEKLMK